VRILDKPLILVEKLFAYVRSMMVWGVCCEKGGLVRLSKKQSEYGSRDVFLKVGGQGNAWVWLRHLWVWEEEILGECWALLLNFSLQAHTSDSL
jgi:hypothetical protein